MSTITYEAIQKTNATLKPIDVKGKPYTPVSERIKAFRMVFPCGSVVTELISNKDGVCVFRATVLTDEGMVLGTGTAYEKESSSYINKTSYIENCETSAVGRALGMAGFGIDGSMCSAEELLNAVKQQEELKRKDREERRAQEEQDAQGDPLPDILPGVPSRVDTVKRFCAAHGITLQQFGRYRNGAVANHVIPDLRVNDLPDEAFDALLRFVDLNVTQPA